MTTQPPGGAHRAPTPANNSRGDLGVAQLQDEIERTRADLADTVDQLASKVEAKARPTAMAVGIGVAALVGVVILVKWRRRASR